MCGKGCDVEYRGWTIQAKRQIKDIFICGYALKVVNLQANSVIYI